ncbi:hypothetical protein Salat_1868500 [Sesamum alatum]|uniref:Uncharacterized protein n=1 Tax=Sesamum alatum TaxID=300844 RepID=A0AAE1Y370_9LAMI|nr:hypothetical protein Salat_1868500 [Sesamum alatum]
MSPKIPTVVCEEELGGEARRQRIEAENCNRMVVIMHARHMGPQSDSVTLSLHYNGLEDMSLKQFEGDEGLARTEVDEVGEGEAFTFLGAEVIEGGDISKVAKGLKYAALRTAGVEGDEGGEGAVGVEGL